MTRRREIPEGSLHAMLARAHGGDVLSIPCLMYTHSDDLMGLHDYFTLYTCVLLATRTRIVLSPLYEEIGHMRPIARTTVYTGDTRITLFDEHDQRIEWYSKTTCRLLMKRRMDLARHYFESLTPEGPCNVSH